MSPLLDGMRLNGPHVARISARPPRTAFPIGHADLEAFRSFVELACQLWGGASDIVIPLNASSAIPEEYRKILPGSQIDDIHGTDYDPEFLLSAAIKPGVELDFFASQLAIGLLPYGKSEERAPVEVCALLPEDPWRDIYLACLGALPLDIDIRIREAGNWLPEVSFSDFAPIRRRNVIGSLIDLLGRTYAVERVRSPRQMSMLHLAYGGTASTSIRTDMPVLPSPQFARLDAGPNVLVICSPESTEDLALLWNLRAAHGDDYATPVGIPAAEFSAEAVGQVLANHGIARQGWAASSLYVTSASMPTEAIVEALGTLPQGVKVLPADQLLTFGKVGGWVREEVLMWEQGRASYKQVDWSSHRELIQERNMSDVARLYVELAVDDSPLPLADDYRVAPFSGAFYNGSHITWSSVRSVNKIAAIEWPSKLLMANSLASARGFALKESAPGVAAKILLEKLGGTGEVSMLCHAPLLALLETMSTRQGFSWYKERLRQRGVEADPTESVGASTDELPEKSFHDFKRALGNSDPATRFWLGWAERASVVIKGFPIQCPTCGAKQWTPVSNFSPPITCRGCAVAIQFPFADRPGVEFKYRLSEQVRRVYESDAMGHLLVARFFDFIYSAGGGSGLIGLHPGISVTLNGAAAEIGEADLLMLTRFGDFIPIEVKRTGTGLTETELNKLAVLSKTLRSPWSGIVACQYARDAGPEFAKLPLRHPDGTHQRMALSYDGLLDPHPMWALSGDPFALAAMDETVIAERESGFVRGLAERSVDTFGDWLTYSMTAREERPGAGNLNQSDVADVTTGD